MSDILIDTANSMVHEIFNGLGRMAPPIASQSQQGSSQWNSNPKYNYVDWFLDTILKGSDRPGISLITVKIERI